MQVSPAEPRTRSRTLEGLAAELDVHWLELGRFITSQRLRSAVHARAAELSAPQLQALVTLCDAGLRMSELAARLGIAESTATRLVDRLEAARLARRSSWQADRRCVMAELTPAGRKLAGELQESRRAYLSELLGALQGDERRELIRLFAKVTETLTERHGS
ncbi:MAG: MarR family winged helix-turn-helix transcriptional regulator [Actinomycetota bacterium]|nr:MarR family transcriptional regulator [Actinomycetota bacterium]